MSAAIQTVLPSKVMEVTVKGKVTQSRRFDKRWFTRVMTPAADEFSQPQSIEIRSSQRLGSAEEMVTVRCRLGGFLGRQYEATDKETGEVQKVRNVIMTLDSID